MMILIGNLQDETIVQELTQLFAPFGEKAQLRVHRKRDRSGAQVCYALATIASANLARKLSARVARLGRRGHRPVVREFVYRACGNERRALDWRQKPWANPERRQGERRTSENDGKTMAPVRRRAFLAAASR